MSPEALPLASTACRWSQKLLGSCVHLHIHWLNAIKPGNKATSELLRPWPYHFLVAMSRSQTS